MTCNDSKLRWMPKISIEPRIRLQKTLERSSGSILCGDALKTLKTIPTRSIQAVVCSPPFNIRNSTGNWKPGHIGNWSNAELLNGYDTYSDDLPHDEYVGWQRACLNQMMRVIPEDGAIFYNHKYRVQNGLMQNREDIVSGFPVRQIIIRRRAGGQNWNKTYFLPTYELIYLIAKPRFKLAPNANKMTDVWYIPQERKKGHPAPFPVELARRCCAAVGKGTILDPFFGSGTTAVAAELEGLDWMGIEISQKYCNMALARLLSVRGGGALVQPPTIAHDVADAAAETVASPVESIGE